MHPDRAIARSDARLDAIAGTKRNRYKYNSREWRAYEAAYVTTRYNVSRAEAEDEGPESPRTHAGSWSFFDGSLMKK